MSGLHPLQFRHRVLRPALQWLDPLVPYSIAAENLLLGTALVESQLTFLYQVPAGPARGVFQVEPRTHRDLWENWLAFRPELASRVRAIAGQRWPGAMETGKTFGPRSSWFDDELETNLAYACAVARLLYRRHPAALPGANDALGLARLHKLAYNTAAGDTVVGNLTDARPRDSVDWFARVVQGGEWA